MHNGGVYNTFTQLLAASFAVSDLGSSASLLFACTVLTFCFIFTCAQGRGDFTLATKKIRLHARMTAAHRMGGREESIHDVVLNRSGLRTKGTVQLCFDVLYNVRNKLHALQWLKSRKATVEHLHTGSLVEKDLTACMTSYHN